MNVAVIVFPVRSPSRLLSWVVVKRSTYDAGSVEKLTPAPPVVVADFVDA